MRREEENEALSIASPGVRLVSQLADSCIPEEKNHLSPGAPCPLSSPHYPLVGEAVPCLLCFGGVFIPPSQMHLS